MNKQNETSQTKPLSQDLDSFEKRLNAVKAKHEPKPVDTSQGPLLGAAWRLSTEMIVSVLVGTGLGYGLDRLFGTTPWIMLVGLGFGFAAGIKGVLRAADKMHASTAHIPIGEDLPDEDFDDEDEE